MFEDNIFFTTYLKHDIIRLNKFGKGEIKYLAQSLTKISDILVLHEKKQLFINNTCDDFCSNSEFCLLTPKAATCTCADGFMKDKLVSALLELYLESTCSLILFVCVVINIISICIK